MKACEKFQRPPTALIAPAYESWGWLDHLLIFAYQLYLDLTCPNCGGYMPECRNKSNRNKYVVSLDQYCYRQAEVDSVTKRDKFKPEPGQLISVQPFDDDLITRSGLVLDRTQHAAQVAGSGHDATND